MEQQLLTWIAHYGALALFGLLALGVVGLPVPNETLLMLAGALVRKGELPLVPCVIAACAGVSPASRSGTCSDVSSARHSFTDTLRGLEQLEVWFERIGKWALQPAFAIKGEFTAIGAGSSEFPFATFARYAYSGAILWTALFLALGYFIGARLASAFEQIHDKTLIACLIGALCVAAYQIYRTRIAGP